MSSTTSLDIPATPVGLGNSTIMASSAASKRKRLSGTQSSSPEKRARVSYSPKGPSASSRDSNSYSTDTALPEPQPNTTSPITFTATTSDQASKESLSDLQWFENRHGHGQDEISTAESNNVSGPKEVAAMSKELQSPRSPPSLPPAEILASLPSVHSSSPSTLPSSPSYPGTKKHKLSGEDETSPSDTAAPRASKRRKSSLTDTSSSSENTSSQRLRGEGKKSVHWPERDILDLNDPHRGVVTSIENIASFSYNVCCDHESMLDVFKEASEEIKNALKYLTPRTMHHIVHYLPDFYDSAFLFVARYFRDKAPDDITPQEFNVSERRDLKRALLEFCALLQQDLVFCQDCEAVHYPKLKLKNCASRWRIAPVHGGSSDVCFEHYQVEVKRARAGLPIIGKLWKSMKSRHVMHISPSVCVLDFWEPYIANQDRMLLRAQKWIIVPFSCQDSHNAIRKYMSSNPLRYDQVLCRHMKEIFDYENIYDCETANAKLDRPERCEECALEFQVDARGLGSIGWAVVVTSWRDLGRCVSIYDPRFQAHFSEYEGFSFTLGHGRSRPRIIFTAYGPGYDFDPGLWLGEDDGQGSDATISDTNANSDPANQVRYATADEEDDALPRGYIEDEEPEYSDLPLGGIRDMFENGEFDLDDCLDEEEFLRLLLCRAHGSTKKSNEETRPFALMPRLKRWGGDVERVADLFPAADGGNVEGEDAEVEEVDREIAIDWIESDSSDDEVVENEVNSDESDGQELQDKRDPNLDPAILGIS